MSEANPTFTAKFNFRKIPADHKTFADQKAKMDEAGVAYRTVMDEEGKEVVGITREALTAVLPLITVDAIAEAGKLDWLQTQINGLVESVAGKMFVNKLQDIVPEELTIDAIIAALATKPRSSGINKEHAAALGAIVEAYLQEQGKAAGTISLVRAMTVAGFSKRICNAYAMHAEKFERILEIVIESLQAQPEDVQTELVDAVTAMSENLSNFLEAADEEVDLDDL